jgi:hypothetical protein
MDSVSYRREPITMPVDFKLHHYQKQASLKLACSRKKLTLLTYLPAA